MVKVNRGVNRFHDLVGAGGEAAAPDGTGLGRRFYLIVRYRLSPGFSGEFSYMSERPASTGKMVVLAVIGVALFSSVVSFVMVTSKVEADACQIEDGVLGSFQTPSEAVLAQPVARLRRT